MAQRAIPGKQTPVYTLTWNAADLPEDNAWMAPDEAAVLAGLRFPKRRAEWRLGRYAAKQALVACLAEAAAQPALSSIAIRAAEDGAPEVFVDDEPAPFTLSISHSGGQAFCVVAPGSVALGCDLEKIEPRSPAFVSDYFTPEEQALVEGAAAADRAWLANLIWSAKESALKALREGLRLDTRSVVVNLAAPQKTTTWRPLVVFFNERGQTFQGWYRVEGGFVQTVAAHPSPSFPMALD